MGVPVAPPGQQGRRHGRCLRCCLPTARTALSSAVALLLAVATLLMALGAPARVASAQSLPEVRLNLMSSDGTTITIPEDGGSMTVTGTLNGVAQGTVTVTISVAPANYNFPDEFASDDMFELSANKVLTFAPGSTASTGTVQISANDNDADQVTARIRITGTVSGNALMQGGGPTQWWEALIKDDDLAPTPTVVLTPSKILEKGGIAQVTVILSHPTWRGDMQLDVRPYLFPAEHKLRPPNQANATDFELSEKVRLEVPVGETQSTGTVTIRAVDNDVLESDEKQLKVYTFNVNAGVVPNEPGLYSPPTVLQILENDMPLGAAVRARFRRLNDEILSKHALTIADVTNRAIGARMDDPRGKRAAAWTLAGGSTIHDALHAKAQALEDGTLTLDDVLTGSSFQLPLGAANDDMAGGGPVVWGRGERQALESTKSAFAWDGTVLTGQLGIDGYPRENLLAGLALSRSIGNLDYSDGTGPAPADDRQESRMTSVHSYLGWLSPQGLALWATVGYGRGDIEIEDAQARDGDPDYPVRRSDTMLTTAAVGARGPLIAEDSPIAGGTMALSVRSEASWAQVEVEGDGGLIAQQTVNAWRLRLVLEGSHKWALASGGSLTPSLELGLRHDGGDGLTGGGVEIGGSLRYRDPATGLTVEGNGRVLTGKDDYREWGLGGSLRLDPEAGGRGLSFSLAPAWGDTASGMDRLVGPGRRRAGGRRQGGQRQRPGGAAGQRTRLWLRHVRRPGAADTLWRVRAGGRRVTTLPDR